MTGRIDPRDRLILALDVPSADEAKRLMDRLNDQVTVVKIGLELYTAAGPDIVRWMRQQGKRVFLDLKLLDIGETIKRATAVAAELGVDFFTVHSGSKSLRAAVEGRGTSAMKILAITVLTNFANQDLQELGIMESPAEAVLRRARLAADCGADGVVASGAQTPLIRRAIGPAFLIVTPGIRPAGSPHDDQVEVCTPAVALAAGSDYLVVGRPIRDAVDPEAAARAIHAEIAASGR
jgi:orotidine-5'-phosphate decarboxylase